MQRFRRIEVLVFLIVFFLAPKLAKAQEQIEMSIASGESFSVHSGESVGIYSNVKNSGSLAAYSNSVISFSGQRWTNMSGSRIVDESANGTSGKGGLFRFRSPTNSLQFIDNKNNQSNVFSNISIANTGNVMLEGEDLLVRVNLNFENGRLILNNRNLVLPENGTITGFNNSRFIVTGTGTNGGFLVKHFSGTQQPDFIFPIGITTASYSPASLNYKGAAQNIKVRVFENVYDRATLGTPDNVNFVPRTWNVSFQLNDPTAVMTLNTQHSASDEGATFAFKRAESFLSRYSGKTGLWDNVTPTAVTIGSLGSGNVVTPNLSPTYLHSRTNISTLALDEYFSKSILKNATLAGLRIPAGISPNNDGLNEKFIIENLRPTDQVKLDIYNRWQTLVFRDGNYKNTFDGIGNQKGLVNNELPDGTYYYILNINTEKPITGYIVINR